MGHGPHTAGSYRDHHRRSILGIPFAVGKSLAAIRQHFSSIYEPPAGYGQLPMDVEFKRVGQGDTAEIQVKQARPYPGRGGAGR